MLNTQTLVKRTLQRVQNPQQGFAQFVTDDVIDFLERFVYDPETGELLVLHDEQKAIIREFARRDENGDFVYSDWVYSAIKKSGKTTVCAGIVLWQGCRVASGHCYVIANDLKQADSRMFRVIEYAVTKHPVLREFAKVVKYKITLANDTVIEALPVDPAGEAGMNPTCIAYTEAWGAKGNKAELMWTEAVLSPSRQGQAFRMVESYAGHTGESLILERLYDNVVKPELCINPDIELYANTTSSTIAYWCTRRIQPWQQGDKAEKYYASERATKTDAEYRRQHMNEWVTSSDVFVYPDWWQRCYSDTAHEGQVVIGVDGAVSGDCFAVVGVSKSVDGTTHVRFSRIYQPDGVELDYSVIEADIRALCRQYPVVCIAYDPMQLHDMMTRLERDGVAWCEKFPQTALRLTADKALRDRIRDGGITHNGDSTLTEHLLNANAKVDADGHRLRIVKRSEARKIDGAVALSMASYQASILNI